MTKKRPMTHDEDVLLRAAEHFATRFKAFDKELARAEIKYGKLSQKYYDGGLAEKAKLRTEFKEAERAFKVLDRLNERVYSVLRKGGLSY